ncbi:hypothetical protein PG997_014586 [Apiospora hydei]|uniref:Uncharacterized protein n=1 Tax=Apiospora hydei TaxID=1337664 RepID=A0ABR1UU85_9PEZI
MTIRLGWHMRPTVFYRVSRESFAAVCRIYNVRLTLHGSLSRDPKLGVALSNASRTLRADYEGPAPTAYLRVSPEHDLFVFHDDQNVPENVYGHWGPRVSFLRRRFTARAGRLTSAQTAAIRHVLVVHWGNFLSPSDPDFLDDAAAKCVDPSIDDLFGQVRTRVDLYVHENQYHGCQHAESKGALPTQLLEQHSDQSVRSIPAPVQQVASEEADL